MSQNLVLGDIQDLMNVLMVDIGVMPRVGALVPCCIEEEAHHHLRNHLSGEEGPHKLVVLEAQRVAGSWEELAAEEGPVVAPVGEEPVYCCWEGNCKWGVVRGGSVLVGRWLKQGGVQNLVEGGSCVVLAGSWDRRSMDKNKNYWMKCL